MSARRLCIDLFCGLGGWTEGFHAEGYSVIGFDIERRPYPAQLVIQDVLTLHGSQFRNAACIVASPPCQAYSYRAMPWKRAKALPPPSNDLFDACFRIQREACEAAGRHIPLIVENVKGAQPWVGRAKWHFGSFYLWGDVPALMPPVHRCAVKIAGQDWSEFSRSGKVSPHWRMEATKNTGGSWFNVAHNTESGKANNARDQVAAGIKTRNHVNIRKGHGHSRSDSRKAASAQIAKIPFPLAQYIAKVFA